MKSLFDKILPNVLIGLGAGVSTYLLILTEFGRTPNFCDVNKVVNCGAVEFSPFSHIMGIPVALLGLVWFVSTAIAWNVRELREYVPFLWILAVIFVSYLISTELILGSICIYCTTAQAAGVLMIIPILLNRKR